MTKVSERVTEFYLNCRNGDVNFVRSHIKTMSTDEINQIEPNGSTALHAACFYGHFEIVRELLEHGADPLKMNKFDCTPFDEAKTVEIKKLFFRPDPRERFGEIPPESIQWIRIDDDSDVKAKAIRKMLKNYAKQFKKAKRTFLIEMVDLGEYENLQLIQEYFDQANEKNDPIPIITAYTADTPFYSKLNELLARIDDLDPNDIKQKQILDFLQLICCHPNFREYYIETETYRGMAISEDEFQKYRVGSKIMTKTVLSTSKKKDIGIHFALQTAKTKKETENVFPCLITYEIRKKHSALDIETLSVYPYEAEVLIVPYTAFEVKGTSMIKTKNGASLKTIHLRQCKSLVSTYMMITTGGGILATTMAAIAAVGAASAAADSGGFDFDFGGF